MQNRMALSVLHNLLKLVTADTKNVSLVCFFASFVVDAAKRVKMLQKRSESILYKGIDRAMSYSTGK